MKTRIIITTAFIAIAITLLTNGCTGTTGPLRVYLPAGPQEPQANPHISQRFEKVSPKSPSAVNSAMEISEKYAKVTEENAALKIQNQELISQNTRLQENITILEAELRQAQKELTQANDLLMQMQTELANWKTNVLGFREEMRGAEQAQLEALFKILQVLGADLPEEDLGNQEETKANRSSSSTNG